MYMYRCVYIYTHIYMCIYIHLISISLGVSEISPSPATNSSELHFFLSKTRNLTLPIIMELCCFRMVLKHIMGYP